MRRAFAHEALVRMDVDADIRAPGAAVSAELCGHWDHEPSCPVAPHHTEADRTGTDVHLRILFAADVEREDVVRATIDRALASGRQRDPDGASTSWQVLGGRPSKVSDTEADHAVRLTRGY